MRQKKYQSPTMLTMKQTPDMYSTKMSTVQTYHNQQHSTAQQRVKVEALSQRESVCVAASELSVVR